MDENLDFSKILDDLGQMLSGEEGQAQLQSVINMLSGSEGQPDGSQSSSSAPDFSAPAGGIDFDTIMRIAQVMQAINSQQDNSKSAFLSALRPFLKKSRQKSLDKAENLLKLATALKILKQTDGGGV